MSHKKTGTSSRVEIQIHPSDIRKRVRYLFLSRGQTLALAGLIILYLGFLAAGIGWAPGVVRGLLARGEHQRLLTERGLQAERLERMVARLQELEEQGDGLRLRLDKIFLAYGLSMDESIGQGGYPFEAVPAVESLHSGLVDEGQQALARLEEQSQVLSAFLGEVHDFEAAHAEQVRTTPSLCPLRGESFVLTSPFGQRRSPFTKEVDFHAGIDLAAPEGSPIYAPADGFVTFAGRYDLKRSVGWWRYGNLVVVRSGDRFVTLFGHCDEVHVKTGQRVRQGELLATVGSTGWSTSPHLHYEVRRRDEDGQFRPVDPRIYILDHRWRDEERLLVRARRAPGYESFEPLPPLLAR